uniref:Uncharacterized protein n=1 Tax=Esox lucius TaxID=8010 RepID=A0A3P9AJT0_ESOLU
MMEKMKPELCPVSPGAKSCSPLKQDSIIRENGCNDLDSNEGNFTGEGIKTDDALLRNPRNGTIILNGVTKETAYDALDLKREVPVIELSRRDDIKAGQQRTDSHTVPITELRRPPVPLPLPHRDALNDARMVQLSPNAFPLPARAMLYNLAQPLAAINSLGGESEQYGMYPSNRVKRRPAPYEVELDEGRRILDLYKYGKTHLCWVLLLLIFLLSVLHSSQRPPLSPPLISTSSSQSSPHPNVFLSVLPSSQHPPLSTPLIPTSSSQSSTHPNVLLSVLPTSQRPPLCPLLIPTSSSQSSPHPSVLLSVHPSSQRPPLSPPLIPTSSSRSSPHPNILLSVLPSSQCPPLSPPLILASSSQSSPHPNVFLSVLPSSQHPPLSPPLIPTSSSQSSPHSKVSPFHSSTNIGRRRIKR